MGAGAGGIPSAYERDVALFRLVCEDVVYRRAGATAGARTLSAGGRILDVAETDFFIAASAVIPILILPSSRSASASSEAKSLGVSALRWTIEK